MRDLQKGDKYIFDTYGMNVVFHVLDVVGLDGGSIVKYETHSLASGNHVVTDCSYNVFCNDIKDGNMKLISDERYNKYVNKFKIGQL